LNSAEKRLRAALRLATWAAFLTGVSVMAAGFYEGVVQRYLPFFFPLLLLQDLLFLVSSVLGLLVHRKHAALRRAYALAAAVIAAGAAVSLIFGHGKIPPVPFLLWEVFILLFTGAAAARNWAAARPAGSVSGTTIEFDSVHAKTR